MKNEKGFTIVEIAVVVPIMMVIIIGMLALLGLMIQGSASERVGAQNLYDARAALNVLQDDGTLTGSFLPILDTGLNDPYKPTTNGNKWSYIGTSETSRVLILRNFATSSNPLDANRKPVFINTQGCGDESIYYNNPLSYDTIYFVDSGTLYRRRITNQSPPSLCGTPYQKQSCPTPARLGTSNRDPSCKADDEVIATDVTSFKVDYYSDSISDSALDVYSSPVGDQQVQASDSIVVTVGIGRRASGQLVSNSQSVRISKIVTGRSDQ